jgi:hypothetical protein
MTTEIEFCNDHVTVETFEDRVVVTVTTSEVTLERQLTAEDARALADALQYAADEADEAGE